jgi:uncharacterized membrane protein
MAMLARETGWVSLTAGVLIISRYGLICPRLRVMLWMPALAMLMAILPLRLYIGLMKIPPTVGLSFANLLDMRLMMDFVVKSGVAFHIWWLVALAGLAIACRSRELPPYPVVAWTAGALLYMGAGLLVNRFAALGYPLRMTYSLFPLVFFLGSRTLQIQFWNRYRGMPICALTALWCLVSVAGVLLDPGTAGIQYSDVFRHLP